MSVALGPDAIGWMASVVLLVTMTRQVWTQWKDQSAKGVSRWLFLGQIAASIGFVVYSALLHNLVFVVTNSLMFLNAVTGLIIDRRNRRGTRQSALSVDGASGR